MKKLVINGSVFFIVALLIYIAVFSGLYFLSVNGTPLLYRTSDVLNWKGGSTYQTFKEFDRKEKYDLIILGSSHAYRGYDPAYFKAEGLKTFNLGSKAQALMNSYYIAKNYVDSSNCKMVILDVFEGPFMTDGMESTSDLVENITLDKPAMQMAFGLRDIRGINMITLRFISKPSSPVYIDSNYVGAGYTETPDSVKLPISYNRVPFEPEERQLHYFKKIIDYFKEQDIPLALVNHPMPEELGASSHHSFVKTLHPYIKKYNVPFLDYALNHSLHSRDHFYDHNHLNKAGVRIFNSVLIEDLKKKDLIRDK